MARDMGYRAAAAKRLLKPEVDESGAGEMDEDPFDVEMPEGPEGFNANANDAAGAGNVYKMAAGKPKKKE